MQIPILARFFIIKALRLFPGILLFVGVSFHVLGQGKPDKPSTTQEGNICADKDFTISTTTTGLGEYVWEYHISGKYITNPEHQKCHLACDDAYKTCGLTDECKLESDNCHKECDKIDSHFPVWESLGTSPKYEFTFIPEQLIFKNGLTKNTNVYFRVRAKNGIIYSDSSKSISFSPPSPKTNPGNVTYGIACKDGTTVYVSGVTSQFPKYRYLLKKDSNGNFCDPKNDCNSNEENCDVNKNQCLKQDDRSGIVDSKTSFEIPDVKAGKYTLYLLNNAGSEGFCPREIKTFTISAHPQLAISVTSKTNLTCYNDPSGNVIITRNGGKPGSVVYELRKGPDLIRTLSSGNASVTFNGLSAGDYRITASDNCTDVVFTTFKITQPVKIEEGEEFKPGIALCANPGDGVVRVKVQRSQGVSAGNMLIYELLKDNKIMGAPREQTGLEYTWSGLPYGNNYKVIVKEKGANMDCNWLVKEFTIEGPPPLGIADLQIVPVSCHNGEDGKLTVAGKGGAGDTFSYKLTGPVNSENLSGEFTGLVAGNYVLKVKNDSDCEDFYEQEITIGQPSELEVKLIKTDISCHGLTDGEITAIVTGGVEIEGEMKYDYIWEKFINNSWATLSNKTDKLANLGEGTYRARAKDANDCIIISESTDINEPGALIINRIIVNDIRCLGESGTMEVVASGGIAPYIFEYSLDEGQNYEEFTQETPLNPGAYRIRAKDANGCIYVHPTLQSITLPPAELNFTGVLSNYNGFNISCFGGSNGFITINATGGNGPGYSGYEYALDERPFQAEATLTGINAGQHTVYVKDNRGCIVSKEFIFTQTSEAISSEILIKKDVLCYGAATGMLDAKGHGGLAPYLYSIDGISFQPNGKFENLAAGNYILTIKDKNDCDARFSYEIIHLNPEIIIASEVKAVSCFGGKDGAIEVQASGGKGTFRYFWKDLNLAGPKASGLPKGAYTLEVTDQEGCVKEALIEVPEPEKLLSIVLDVIPVCYGKETGSITAKPSGGTAPYRYSIDGGNQFQNHPVFVGGVGTYAITAEDSKGCVSTATAEIILRNDKPDPNFLVATKRNALDTLVITDISVPRPDSIHWAFDSRAVVVVDDPWVPQVVFNEAGTYTVTMTSFFQKCEYQVTKLMNVNPYDSKALQEKLPGFKPIESVEATPNPSTGSFKVAVKLNKKYNLSIAVYDMLGVKHYSGSWEGVEGLAKNLSLDKAPNGVYLLRAVTDTDAKDVRLIINK